MEMEERNVLTRLAEAERDLEREEETIGVVVEEYDGSLSLWCEIQSKQGETDMFTPGELTRLVKKYAESNEEIANMASKLLGWMCGEGTRGLQRCRFVFTEANSFEFELPTFAQADVGCRAWGAAKLLASWVLNSDDLPNLLKGLEASRVVELGCGAFPLSGIVVASAINASKLILTDMNHACLESAKKNASQCSSSGVASMPEEIETAYYKWGSNDVPAPAADIVVGAAVVYETIHAQLLPNAILRCLGDNGGLAVIAIHEEQTGFHEFLDVCRQVGLRIAHQVGPVHVTEKGPSLTCFSSVFIFVFKKDPREE